MTIAPRVRRVPLRT